MKEEKCCVPLANPFNKHRPYQYHQQVRYIPGSNHYGFDFSEKP